MAAAMKALAVASPVPARAQPHRSTTGNVLFGTTFPFSIFFYVIVQLIVSWVPVAMHKRVRAAYENLCCTMRVKVVTDFSPRLG
jgi:hypothetical protein